MGSPLWIHLCSSLITWYPGIAKDSDLYKPAEWVGMQFHGLLVGPDRWWYHAFLKFDQQARPNYQNVELAVWEGTSIHFDSTSTKWFVFKRQISTASLDLRHISTSRTGCSFIPTLAKADASLGSTLVGLRKGGGTCGTITQMNPLIFLSKCTQIKDSEIW